MIFNELTKEKKDQILRFAEAFMRGASSNPEMRFTNEGHLIRSSLDHGILMMETLNFIIMSEDSLNVLIYLIEKLIQRPDLSLIPGMLKEENIWYVTMDQVDCADELRRVGIKGIAEIGEESKRKMETRSVPLLAGDVISMFHYYRGGDDNRNAIKKKFGIIEFR